MAWNKPKKIRKKGHRIETNGNTTTTQKGKLEETKPLRIIKVSPLLEERKREIERKRVREKGKYEFP